MDFITDLPVSNSYNSIWIIVNLFIKMAYFVPLEMNRKKKPITLSVFSLSIINDYTVYLRILFPIGIFALRFSFGRIFFKLISIKPRINTAFHL